MNRSSDTSDMNDSVLTVDGGICDRRYRHHEAPPPLTTTEETDMSERRAEDGWIEWNGGNRPIDTDTLVEIKLRNGLSNEGRAYSFDWWHGYGPFGYENDVDIIAYRAVAA